MKRLEQLLGWEYKIKRNVATACVICAAINFFVSLGGFNLGALVVVGKLSIIFAMNLVIISTSERSFDDTTLDSLLSFYPLDKREYIAYYSKKMVVAGIIMLPIVMLTAAASRFSNIRELVVLATLLVFSIIHVMLSALIALRKKTSFEIDIAGFYVCEVLLLAIFVPLTLFIMAVGL